MKKSTTLKITSIIILLMMVTMSVFAANQGNNQGMNARSIGQMQSAQTYELYDDTQINHQLQINSLPMEGLTADEIYHITYMREEEKLARDVYLELYDQYGLQIFSNIAQSEQTHTNAVKSLILKYDLIDPVTNDERGVFTNPNLQDLYTVLVNKGSISLLDALTVGATIEDLDIMDLVNAREEVNNQDIIAVFENLEKGSRNHLRSFTRTLERNGGAYAPQYLSQEVYDEIISSYMETGQGSQTQMNQQKTTSPAEEKTVSSQKKKKRTHKMSLRECGEVLHAGSKPALFYNYIYS